MEASSGRWWGFKVLVCRRRFHAPTAIPAAVGDVYREMTIVEAPTPSSAQRPFSAAAALLRWTPATDAALVRWFNERAEQQQGSVLDVDPAHFSPSASDLQTKFVALAAIPAKPLLFRAAIIQKFNALLRRCLPWLDLGGGSEAGRKLGELLRRNSHLVFAEIKQCILNGVRERTRGAGGASKSIVLDNFLASQSLSNGTTGIASSNSCFAQAFRELHFADVTFLRSCWDGDRVFQVNFRGEHGSDAGGVFREGMSRCMEDLYSGAIDLLARTPNNRTEAGRGADKWLPNVDLAGAPLAHEMLCFVGKLMAMSGRTMLCLPFNFPRVVWRRLLRQPVTLEDIEEVDEGTASLLRRLQPYVEASDQARNALRHGIDDDLHDESRDRFEEAFAGALLWTAPRLNGNGVLPLRPGGEDLEVAFEEIGLFARALHGAVFSEVLPLIDEVARGFDMVLPLRALALHTCAEAEVVVCGRASFDMAWWRTHTNYAGYEDTDEVIQNFWCVVNAWGDEQRSNFVRFAWGRSRLPPRESWYKDMQISRSNISGGAEAIDSSLPMSHTCFFSVELPPYTSIEAMRRGLNICITYGLGGVLNT
uniref:HECT domain-containing protein n=1 Tax=Phaeomonas parva TaxID=124430 RepID=A0A6U4CS48_9STRA